MNLFNISVFFIRLYLNIKTYRQSKDRLCRSSHSWWSQALGRQAEGRSREGRLEGPAKESALPVAERSPCDLDKEPWPVSEVLGQSGASVSSVQNGQGLPGRPDLEVKLYSGVVGSSRVTGCGMVKEDGFEKTFLRQNPPHVASWNVKDGSGSSQRESLAFV